MAGSLPPCSMDLSGWLLVAPRSVNTPQKRRLGVLVLLQILCFQTARSQVYPDISLEGSQETEVPVVNVESLKLVARCIIISKPLAHITWDTGSFKHNASDTFIQYDNMTGRATSDLFMKPRRELFNFKVTCVATVEKIQYNTSISIKNIEFAPYDVHIKKVQRHDDTWILYCDMTANPPPHTFKWTWGKDYETVQIPNEYRFLVLPKNVSDGYYSCEVENTYGRASGRFYLDPESKQQHPYWYVTLIFLIPSLILNVGLLVYCLKSRRPTESPGKAVL